MKNKAQCITKCKCNAGFSDFSGYGSLLQHRQFIFDDWRKKRKYE